MPTMDNCVDDVHKWCASKRVQLTSPKIEVIWFGINANLKKLQSVDLSLLVGADTIAPVDAVHDLGVILDGEPTMASTSPKSPASAITICRRLKQGGRILGHEIAARLVSAYFISRLDYCNSVLADESRTISPGHYPPDNTPCSIPPGQYPSGQFPGTIPPAPIPRAFTPLKNY